MDAQVDFHLGDSISVVLSTGETKQLRGFITTDSDGGGVQGLDPIRMTWRAKIEKTDANRAILPAGPASIRRITAAILPTVYRPAANTIDDNGHAWLFDLQVART